MSGRNQAVTHDVAAARLASLAVARPLGIAARQAVRDAGLAYARAYRLRQPFRALLDRRDGPETRAAAEAYPFRSHRTCAEWTEREVA